MPNTCAEWAAEAAAHCTTLAQSHAVQAAAERAQVWAVVGWTSAGWLLALGLVAGAGWWLWHAQDRLAAFRHGVLADLITHACRADPAAAADLYARTAERACRDGAALRRAGVAGLSSLADNAEEPAA